MSYMLDTNILSEEIKANYNHGVRHWMQTVALDDLYLCILTLGEIRQGIERMPEGKRKIRYMEWLLNSIKVHFEHRILDVDWNIVQQWGMIAAKYPSLSTIDGLLAATAISHDLTLVSADRDFTIIKELKLLNPWQHQL